MKSAKRVINSNDTANCSNPSDSSLEHNKEGRIHFDGEKSPPMPTCGNIRGTAAREPLRFEQQETSTDLTRKANTTSQHDECNNGADRVDKLALNDASGQHRIRTKEKKLYGPVFVDNVLPYYDGYTIRAVEFRKGRIGIDIGGVDIKTLNIPFFSGEYTSDVAVVRKVNPSTQAHAAGVKVGDVFCKHWGPCTWETQRVKVEKNDRTYSTDPIRYLGAEEAIQCCKESLERPFWVLLMREPTATSQSAQGRSNEESVQSKTAEMVRYMARYL